jgi:zinc transporter ZupT
MSLRSRIALAVFAGGPPLVYLLIGYAISHAMGTNHGLWMTGVFAAAWLLAILWAGFYPQPNTGELNEDSLY